MKATIAYIPNSHLDLYWLGSYQTCLERGSEILKSYLDRCTEYGETFLIETVVFLEYFLDKHPEYKEILAKLFQMKKIDIGTAYVDRWESLVQGESLVRNIIIGKRTLKELLGIDSLLAAHPDLPSVASQIGQIYSQAGIKYYCTTRKIYPMGGVWRQQAPDGSSVLFLNLPLHYIFFGLDPHSDQHLNAWMGTHARCNIADLFQGFPAGTVLLPGGAGDLTMRKTFIERYEGKSLQDYVEKYKQLYPEYEFTYATASQVLAEYESGRYEVPTHTGEIPSVWGVACDETVKFFQNDRLWERLLLIAEQLTSFAQHAGRKWLPSNFTDWQGKFYESAFYKPNDNFTIKGEVFSKLWQMLVFTQDHNGGGYEGALSTFQKRVTQERGMDYATKIIGEVLGGKPDEIVLYNPSSYVFSGYVTVPKFWKDKNLPPCYPQAIQIQEDYEQIYLGIDSLSPFSSQYLATTSIPPAAPHAVPMTENIGPEVYWVLGQKKQGKVYISQESGNLCAWEGVLSSAIDGSIGALEMEEELHSDVTLRCNKDEPVTGQEFLGLGSYQEGPIFQRVSVKKILDNCLVEQSYTLFHSTGELEISCKIHWAGTHYKQVRMRLVGYAERDAISYGTPFFANSYSDCIATAAPRNPDELLLEDFQAYRETQGWVALPQGCTWLSILSNNTGIYAPDAKDGMLSAVLIRTAPSCGDHRFFWDNAGTQCFSFRYFATSSSASIEQSKQHSALLAHRFLNYAPLAMHCGAEQVSTMRTTAAETMPSPQSASGFTQPLCIESEEGSVLISALYPAQDTDGWVLRLLNASFQVGKATLGGPFLEGRVSVSCNLLEQEQQALNHPLTLRPWEIQTLLIR